MKTLIDRMGALLQPLVSIIIVNWNGRSYLPDCLDSLAEQTFGDFEVILVDNGSVDDSVSFVRESYPWVKLVLLDTNTGFAKGNNFGLEHASGDYIVTLNNDTRAEAGWLAALVRTAHAHPGAGMVGCRIAHLMILISSIRLAWESVGTVCRGGVSATDDGQRSSCGMWRRSFLLVPVPLCTSGR